MLKLIRTGKYSLTNIFSHNLCFYNIAFTKARAETISINQAREELLGEYVEVASLDRTVKGQAVDVDRDGALLIKHVDGTMSRVISGDVTLKRFYKPHIKIPHHYDA